MKACERHSFFCIPIWGMDLTQLKKGTASLLTFSFPVSILKK